MALVECAKMAYRDGKKVQFVLDDMGIELLDVPELQLAAVDIFKTANDIDEPAGSVPSEALYEFIEKATFEIDDFKTASFDLFC